MRAHIAALLQEGHQANTKTKPCAKNLRKLGPAHWTFLRVPGVDLTNNAAGRSQRRGIMKRDHTFSTQTNAGSRYVERIHTTVATCRQQGRNALTYHTDALVAALNNSPGPSFIAE